MAAAANTGKARRRNEQPVTRMTVSSLSLAKRPRLKSVANKAPAGRVITMTLGTLYRRRRSTIQTGILLLTMRSANSKTIPDKSITVKPATQATNGALNSLKV
jgi:hypothetical protein